ncbi:DegT/DnrJ/EryC1/StrS family aminotransferase [Alphaproteobacteria bacterium]|nr:DegT/DnrJ/EryC1/StrS family aminotransferase [Alphaproteobacteria bacterium]
MNKSIAFIDLAAQQKRLHSKITNRINTVLSHGKYIMGPEVSELEKELEIYTGANHAVTCGSGTDALVLALMSYNIGPGDIVFCPAFTFPATAEAIAILGATPYFIDVEEETFNISINSLNEAIIDIMKDNTYKMKAIIAVDLYGLPANYKALKDIAKTNNLKLIADAAQSFGAEYFNKKVGFLADITCISFFPAKPLGCYGDGGAIITNNEFIAQKIKSLRVHGKGKSKYEIDYIGLNSRLDTIQAAIILAKLEDFDWEFKKRNSIAHNYTTALKEKISTPYIPEESKSIWAQYTVRHKDREMIQNDLKSKGIPTMVYYPVPMHMQKAYKKFYRGRLINSEKLAQEVFSLPMYPDMSNEDQEYIIENIIKIIK